MEVGDTEIGLSSPAQDINNLENSIREWNPTCDDEFKPAIGKVFDTLEEGGNFYKRYAHCVGFSVRNSSETKDKDGVKWKYFLCSKEGFKVEKMVFSPELIVSENSLPKTRKRKMTREGCNARIAFKRTIDGRYEVAKFFEGHTHALVTPRKKQFLRSTRSVSNVHKNLLFSCNRANVGTSKVYQLLKEQVGSYDNIGCTKRDIQNYSRNLKELIKDSDAHIFIDNFRRKKETSHSFYYDFEVDKEGRLKYVFWADGISRKNYSLFGDVISFDTTYNTNKYHMIFAPFTGVNHHRQSITFGAALLADEKVDSFVWLFESFLKAMGGHKPIVVITDQDPAMKIAIEKVFTGSSHRFCMWHILKKLSEKVGASLNGNVDFNSRFMSCVWNSDSSKEFESRWKTIINEFGLEENGWLCQMYDIRNMWIPAYFNDIFLGGILRTTSRSESENSFFGNYLNKNLSLVEFWIRYDSAIDSQRYKELLADNDTLHSIPELKLHMDLEKHGREIYTHENFYIFQKELWSACVDCGIEGTKEKSDRFVFYILDNNMVNNNKVSKHRKVICHFSDDIARCSCKMFESEGMPCRHILFVLKGKGLNEIPSGYIVNRWTKLATSKPIFDCDGNVLEGCSRTGSESKLVSDAWAQLFKCMHVAGRCKDKLNFIINEGSMMELKLANMNNELISTTIDEVEAFIGSNVPKEIQVLPPEPSNTKGCGKRIKGGKEMAMEQQQKKTRLCRVCKQYAYHDSRNCPTKISS
ncbi:protein FAR1-RELATED SEQUENCE 5-like [Vicia villosa]|uniref:protein FAR1-RELATED SEQUENCE 5-like n=1 Tax=Vicia villosa TaxID=3911 RepID=UPI00273CC992|nr:protein FAR1-RELATED SEQUENCE 5-like [Vicia villosa]